MANPLSSWPSSLMIIRGGSEPALPGEARTCSLYSPGLRTVHSVNSSPFFVSRRAPWRDPRRASEIELAHFERLRRRLRIGDGNVDPRPESARRQLDIFRTAAAKATTRRQCYRIRSRHRRRKVIGGLEIYFHQIANRIVVLGPIEPVEGHAAGILKPRRAPASPTRRRSSARSSCARRRSAALHRPAAFPDCEVY